MLGTGIDAAKLADGSISNTEFQYLNGSRFWKGLCLINIK
jgi:hypothetical protein